MLGDTTGALMQVHLYQSHSNVAGNKSSKMQLTIFFEHANLHQAFNFSICETEAKNLDLNSSFVTSVYSDTSFSPTAPSPGSVGGLFMDGEDSATANPAEDISKWSVEDVCGFISSLAGCAEYTQVRTRGGGGEEAVEARGRLCAKP